MLKRRIIPVLLLKDGRMVKGKKFKDFRDTGNPRTAVKIYNSQYADELMFIDIDATLQSRKALIDILSNAAKESLMPLSVGGGIRNIEDARQILATGADKVLITSEAFQNHSFIKEAVKRFGSQAIILGIDYKFNLVTKKNEVWTHCGTKPTTVDPIKLIEIYKSLDVGEIMLNSIDRDGMMGGYDIELGKWASKILDIPLIMCGGAGNFQHIEEIFKNTQASAAACSSVFHFGDNCPMQARTYLRNHGVEMRSIK